MCSSGVVAAWLDGITPSSARRKSVTAYATPPISLSSRSDNQKKRKLRSAEMDDDEQTPKRHKPLKRTASSVSSRGRSVLSDGICLSASSSQLSSQISRPGSPKRALLNQLRVATPAVNWCYLSEQDLDLPEPVRGLLQDLTSDYGRRVVPIELRARLQDIDPWGTPLIQPSSFDSDDSIIYDVEKTWSLVEGTMTYARDLHLNAGDENAWCDHVIGPMMRGVTGIHKDFFTVTNIQSQVIEAEYCPKSINLLPIIKKADYAWSFSKFHRSIAPYYKRLLDDRKIQGLSQTTDPRDRNQAMFCGVEVKRSSGDADEGLAQLAIWLSAGLRKTRQLKALSDDEAERNQPTPRKKMVGVPEQAPSSLSKSSQPQQPLSLPLIGWTVRGHDWRFYIAWLDDPKSPSSATTVVSLPFLDQSTATYLGIFIILDTLRRVERYGRETYWPWLKDEVYEPLLVRGDID